MIEVLREVLPYLPGRDQVKLAICSKSLMCLLEYVVVKEYVCTNRIGRLPYKFLDLWFKLGTEHSVVPEYFTKVVSYGFHSLSPFWFHGGITDMHIVNYDHVDITNAPKSLRNLTIHAPMKSLNHVPQNVTHLTLDVDRKILIIPQSVTHLTLHGPGDNLTVLENVTHLEINHAYVRKEFHFVKYVKLTEKCHSYYLRLPEATHLEVSAPESPYAPRGFNSLHAPKLQWVKYGDRISNSISVIDTQYRPHPHSLIL